MTRSNRQTQRRRWLLVIRKAGRFLAVGIAFAPFADAADQRAYLIGANDVERQPRLLEIDQTSGELDKVPVESAKTLAQADSDAPALRPGASTYDASWLLPAQSDPFAPEPAKPVPDESRSAPDPFSRPPGDLLHSLSDIRVALDTPAKETAVDETFELHGTLTLAPHSWPNQTPEAAAYRFVSSPLWYEDPNLERCGESCGCLQPVVSGAYFFGNTALLPYRFVAEPQCETVPTKPFCPPGSRYSFRENYLPKPDLGGSAAQAAAVTGLIFLIP